MSSLDGVKPCNHSVFRSLTKILRILGGWKPLYTVVVVGGQRIIITRGGMLQCRHRFHTGNPGLRIRTQVFGNRVHTTSKRIR